jgi:hypothetical protein
MKLLELICSFGLSALFAEQCGLQPPLTRSASKQQKANQSIPFLSAGTAAQSISLNQKQIICFLLVD